MGRPHNPEESWKVIDKNGKELEKFRTRLAADRWAIEKWKCYFEELEVVRI